jgi:BMFP domain-containing protein YqiC
MTKSEKLLKLLSNFIQNGILTSDDVKKQILTNLKFTKENIIDKLKLVTREEFNILKKIVEKQEKQIKNLSKNKKTKKAKKS